MLVATVTEDGTVRLSTTGTMMLVVSMALGTVIGEVINIDARFDDLGKWLRDHTGSSGDPRFVDCFVTASLTLSIGAMAIVGSIQDGLAGDWSTLALKGSFDAIIVCAMTASMGKGCIFSALSVGVFQGLVTALATLIAPALSDAALANLTLVGSALIFCVGINVIWPRTFKPANMLPAVLIAAACAGSPGSRLKWPKAWLRPEAWFWPKAWLRPEAWFKRSQGPTPARGLALIAPPG